MHFKIVVEESSVAKLMEVVLLKLLGKMYRATSENCAMDCVDWQRKISERGQ